MRSFNDRPAHLPGWDRGGAPADLRARGFAVTTGAMHLLGDAASPYLIGAASDVVGLTTPVLVTGLLLAVAGVVLLVDRASLERDTGGCRRMPAPEAVSGFAPLGAGIRVV